MTYGIIGGSGATGRAVARELLRCGEAEILIGGRDAPAHVDVMDAQSLDAFCKRCGVIVNCAGPVMLLQDRVAQAAFRARCHYVDPAGMEFVKEGMLAHARAIADEGLTFAVSAGWMPGITELFPVYAHAQAQAQMGTIESVSVYFGDSGEWSDNAMRDGVFHLRKAGMPKPAYFPKGERVAVKMSAASRKADLGDPIGVRNFSLLALPEMDEVGNFILILISRERARR